MWSNCPVTDLELKVLVPHRPLPPAHTLPAPGEYCVPAHLLGPHTYLQLRPPRGAYDWSVPLAWAVAAPAGQPLMVRVAGLRGLEDFHLPAPLWVPAK